MCQLDIGDNLILNSDGSADIITKGDRCGTGMDFSCLFPGQIAQCNPEIHGAVHHAVDIGGGRQLISIQCIHGQRQSQNLSWDLISPVQTEHHVVSFDRHQRLGCDVRISCIDLIVIDDLEILQRTVQAFIGERRQRICRLEHHHDLIPLPYQIGSRCKNRITHTGRILIFMQHDNVHSSLDSFSRSCKSRQGCNAQHHDQGKSQCKQADRQRSVCFHIHPPCLIASSDWRPENAVLLMQRLFSSRRTFFG